MLGFKSANIKRWNGPWALFRVTDCECFQNNWASWGYAPLTTHMLVHTGTCSLREIVSIICQRKTGDLSEEEGTCGQWMGPQRAHEGKPLCKTIVKGRRSAREGLVTPSSRVKYSYSRNCLPFWSTPGTLQRRVLCCQKMQADFWPIQWNLESAESVWQRISSEGGTWRMQGDKDEGTALRMEGGRGRQRLKGRWTGFPKQLPWCGCAHASMGSLWKQLLLPH